MKNLTRYILISFSSLMLACGDTYEAEELSFSNTYGPFVQIRNFLPLTVNENTTAAASRSVTVDVPVPVYADVHFTYDFEGSTAIFGEDFTIAGATELGGEATIEYDPDLYAIDGEILVITYLTDGIQDGNKTLVIRLVSASINGEPINVGRNGVARSKTITIRDIN